MKMCGGVEVSSVILDLDAALVPSINLLNLIVLEAGMPKNPSGCCG
jgi:hypothetical protein